MLLGWKSRAGSPSRLLICLVSCHSFAAALERSVQEHHCNMINTTTFSSMHGGGQPNTRRKRVQARAGKQKRAGIYLRVLGCAEAEVRRTFYAQPLTVHTNR